MESSPKRRKITLSLEFDDDAFSPPDPRDKIVQAWETAALSLFSQSSSGKPETGATQAKIFPGSLPSFSSQLQQSSLDDITLPAPSQPLKLPANWPTKPFSPSLLAQSPLSRLPESSTLFSKFKIPRPPTATAAVSAAKQPPSLNLPGLSQSSPPQPRQTTPQPRQVAQHEEAPRLVPSQPIKVIFHSSPSFVSNSALNSSTSAAQAPPSLPTHADRRTSPDDDDNSLEYEPASTISGSAPKSIQQHPSDDAAQAAKPAAKPRGRPRKYPIKEPTPPGELKRPDFQEPQKKRGRPRKQRISVSVDADGNVIERKRKRGRPPKQGDGSVPTEEKQRKKREKKRRNEVQRLFETSSNPEGRPVDYFTGDIIDDTKPRWNAYRRAQLEASLDPSWRVLVDQIGPDKAFDEFRRVFYAARAQKDPGYRVRRRRAPARDQLTSKVGGLMQCDNGPPKKRRKKRENAEDADAKVTGSNSEKKKKGPKRKPGNAAPPKHPGVIPFRAAIKRPSGPPISRPITPQVAIEISSNPYSSQEGKRGTLNLGSTTNSSSSSIRAQLEFLPPTAPASANPGTAATSVSSQPRPMKASLLPTLSPHPKPLRPAYVSATTTSPSSVEQASPSLPKPTAGLLFREPSAVDSAAPQSATLYESSKIPVPPSPPKRRTLLPQKTFKSPVRSLAPVHPASSPRSELQTNGLIQSKVAAKPTINAVTSADEGSSSVSSSSDELQYLGTGRKIFSPPMKLLPASVRANGTPVNRVSSHGASPLTAPKPLFDSKSPKPISPLGHNTGSPSFVAPRLSSFATDSSSPKPTPPSGPRPNATNAAPAPLPEPTTPTHPNHPTMSRQVEPPSSTPPKRPPLLNPRASFPSSPTTPRLKPPAHLSSEPLATTPTSTKSRMSTLASPVPKNTPNSIVVIMPQKPLTLSLPNEEVRRPASVSARPHSRPPASSHAGNTQKGPPIAYASLIKALHPPQ